MKAVVYVVNFHANRSTLSCSLYLGKLYMCVIVTSPESRHLKKKKKKRGKYTKLSLIKKHFCGNTMFPTPATSQFPCCDTAFISHRRHADVCGRF